MIAHVAFWTSNLGRLSEFWRIAFQAEIGAEYASTRRPGFRSRFIKLPDGSRIELMTGPWICNEKPEERQGCAHIALSLGSKENVDASVQRFAEQGYHCSAPRWTGDGYYEAILLDPDGNEIELTI